MAPFLYSIARAYVVNESENLIDCCFVFPNKRSGVFFHHAFAKVCKELKINLPHPATTTISDFIESMVEGKPGERLELIFILYQAYREVIYRHAGGDRKARDVAEMVDFNRFQRWADMLLGDFNDVDMYLVDPEQVFPNLKRYREISANYIDPAVLEEIKRHWKLEKLPDDIRKMLEEAGQPIEREFGKDVDERLWKHIGAEDGSAIHFFRLWQVMLEVYETFRGKLQQAGLFYSGMAYRRAVEVVRERGRREFEYKRYIFVGFNMLSTAEEKIFSLMKDKPGDSPLNDAPLADFYFDDASPAFRTPGNTAALFLEKYKKKFTPIYDCIEPVEEFPKIEIVGVTSRIGQAKIAGGICGLLYPRNDDRPVEELRKTAIVLPQENMAQGVLSSLPEWISPVNLTMGYRLRDSRTAAFVRDIVSMHLRAGKNRGGMPQFFYEDVLKVLTHPLVRQLHPDLHRQIVYDIRVKRMYTIAEIYFSENFPELKPIFSYVENPADPNQVFRYFENLFRWIHDCWDRITSEDAAVERGEVPVSEELKIDVDGIPLENPRKVKASAIVDKMLTQAYLRAIERLKSLTAKYLARQEDLFLADSTMFHLLERLIGGESITFAGRPLEGLQVMGVLEARGLDFENIIIPSMNERIFPRKHLQKSFIPPHLRSAYGMATREHQECIYSYYFFRMISRAKRVFLLYDTRTQGTCGGQMSRYLAQLIYIFRPPRMQHKLLGYKFGASEGLTPSAPKTPEVMKELERFRSVENPRYLSASSINTYINCPLSFYLSYIAGFKRENEYHDYMDESTYGTIIHGVLEDLYKKLRKEHPGVRFTREMMEGLKRRTTEIERAIRIRINRHYNLIGEDRDDELHGDAEIFGELIKKYILLLIDRETELGEFEFIAGEYGEPMELEISDGVATEKINFRFSIDRVDRLWFHPGTDSEWESILRVVDYKTGSDATEIVEIKDMFEPRTRDTYRAKAMLQLFLYCQALAQLDGIREPIMPCIFPVRKVATQGFSPLKITEKESGAKRGKKVPIMDYRDYLHEFNKRMLDVLSDLFNPEIPFEASDDPHSCNFCEFRELCRRKKD